VVDPGSEYQKVCCELAEALYKLTDPCSGRSVVKAVSISYEQFHGPYLPQLPDITVLWDQSFSWDSIEIPGHGILKLRQQDARTGSHSPQGFFILYGPDVPSGRSLSAYSTYDIAPTVLETARVSIPEDMDGSPIVLQ
jgi:predicted AlkP superfamily phosphohydrolase/phosphomutase